MNARINEDTMEKYTAAQQALLLIKKAKGIVDEEDIDLTIQTYGLSESQIGDFIAWVNQNDLAIETLPADEKSFDASSVYFKDISQYPLLSAEKEYELAVRSKNGDVVARSTIVKSNLRLVVAIARRYGGSNLSLNDLIQEGNVGLMKAAEKYDPDKGIRFAGYASYWIRKYISLAINQDHMIHLPVNIVEEIQQMNRVEKLLEQKLERMPTENEIASELKADVRRVRQLQLIQYYPVSMNRIINEEKDVELGDIIPDEREDEALFDEDLDRMVNRILEEISERDREIIRMRYGLSGYENHTLQQIADKYGVSKERVRQIESQIIRMIRERIAALSEKEEA